MSELVLKDLYEEHQLFLFALDVFEKEIAKEPQHQAPAPQFFPLLSDFFSFLEKHHHGKEEEFLFPIIDQEKISDVGGVNCTNYFSPRVLESAFLNPYRALEEELDRASLPAPAQLRPLHTAMQRKGSPLVIPLADHVVGARAAGWLSSMQGCPRDALYFPLRKYSAFLRSHIEREDNCLFPQCERMLEGAARKAYLDAAAAWDERFSLRQERARLRGLLEALRDG